MADDQAIRDAGGGRAGLLTDAGKAIPVKADEAYYDYMLRYSSYDNVAAKAYPALFVGTGLWDSQVQYYEPAKWVARLREMKTDANPLVFRINLEAGHGGKSGRFERYRQNAEG